MRVTYRQANNKDYWTRRWSDIPADGAMANRHASPLKAEVGDITNLAFPDAAFTYVLAFGLYHNLNEELGCAVAETFRVLKPGGVVCASFRADNLQTRLTDWLHAKRHPAGKNAVRLFHKMNLTRGEFRSLFEKAGFTVESVVPVEKLICS